MQRPDLYGYAAGVGALFGAGVGALLTALAIRRGEPVTAVHKVGIPALLAAAGAIGGLGGVYEQLNHPGLRKRIPVPEEDAPAKEKLKYAILALSPKPPSWYVY